MNFHTSHLHGKYQSYDKNSIAIWVYTTKKDNKIKGLKSKTKN